MKWGLYLLSGLKTGCPKDAYWHIDDFELKLFKNQSVQGENPDLSFLWKAGDKHVSHVMGALVTPEGRETPSLTVKRIQIRKTHLNKPCITFTHLLPKPRPCLDSFLTGINSLSCQFPQKCIVSLSQKYKKCLVWSFLWVSIDDLRYCECSCACINFFPCYSRSSINFSPARRTKGG